MKTIVQASALALSLSACSFFGKQPPLHPHYYDPEPEPSAGGARENSGKSVRVGHVVAASHLRERIAYHVSDRELGFYDERRWTERPENYLRRELARELFDRRGLVQIVSGIVPTLEVELIDFSELRGEKHAVRVKARVLLVDAKNVRFEQTFDIEQKVEGEGFDGVPNALGRALSQLVHEIGQRVTESLPAPTT